MLTCLQRNGILVPHYFLDCMTDSILDKVLSRKEDQEKQEFQPVEVINGLLKALSTKEADVLRRRYGLSEKGKETLETIGSFYTVTRERIRQIENQSIDKIKGSGSYTDIMRPVEHLVVSLLTHHGGVMTHDMMYESLLSVNSTSTLQRDAVYFIISELLRDKVDDVPKVKKYHPAWKLKLTSMEFVDSVVVELERLMKELGEPKQFDELYKRFGQTAFYQANDQRLNDEAIESIVEVSTKLSKNPFDDYGLARWGLIVPKRMNDRVYLVLQKEGKPMHFEDIAERISKVFKKKAYPPTVHNELILNKEYVLVGRGIYALKDWGFKEGVVSDVIVDLLTKVGRPMTRTQIVAEVLQQRIVKKNTIHLALTDKTLFKKTADGLYSLIQAPSNDAIAGGTENKNS